ncbi:MAG TPA: hypothetical protein EYO33_06065 [Phycisphaerales bacterium]|nr:hypothetical protein [Phycisphaerales bacterium]
MRILYLEPEQWRRDAFTASFAEIAGGAAEPLCSSSLGEFAGHLQSPFDAAVLPPEVPKSREHSDATTLDEILAWYLSRQKPPLGLWKFSNATEIASETIQLGKEIAIEVSPNPADENGYRNWVREFCTKHQIRYLLPARSLEWWMSQRWLVISNEGGYLASSGIGDEELFTDLLNFFALKSTQLQQTLSSDSWLSWEFSSPDGPIHIQAAKNEHTVLYQSSDENLEIGEQALYILQSLSLVKQDA